MVVAETDYQNFAVLYLERAGQLSVKLYGMWGPASLTRQAGAQALHTHWAIRGGWLSPGGHTLPLSHPDPPAKQRPREE